MTRTYERAPQGWVRTHSGELARLPNLPPRKEAAPCCVARTDPQGRLPIGLCSPGCVRRRRRG